MLVTLVLSACNMPTNATPTEVVPPDAVFTAAAETMTAQLASTVVPSVVDQPTITKALVVPETSSTPEPTLTSTPTETPTPTEIPQVILQDDFSDQTSWYAYEDDRYGFKYSDAGYHIYNTIANGAIWSIRELTFSHVALEVSGTRQEGPADSYFGVVCNFSDDGDNYYTLVIGDDGFYGLGLMENGEYDFLESGTDENNIIKRGQGITNRIRGVCNGGHFLLYANGELLLDVWDDSLDEGIVGIVVGNKQTGGRAEFRFNDFAITYP
ncbi:MAG TPA: hypothetical protein DEH22_01410 [Chloroflexi bacterium]|nr:hypothetical protein [Chloroflexota bacterium]